MNGILALGHFCDSHGPCVILCTQGIGERYPVQPPHSLTVPWCNACKSIEVNNAFVSRDTSTYVTTRTALRQEMAFLLKQACVRSLSCEEETGKEGGTVYFGDCERGHVLSYTFRLPDSRARGFYRLFTVILLMRDKVHLLNSWPFVTTQVRELINYLKQNAAIVNTAEQTEISQRMHRLATGTPVGSPRSLTQLTGLSGVFGHTHLWFTWILTTGAKVLTEQTNGPLNRPPWLGSETDEGFTLVQMTVNSISNSNNPISKSDSPISNSDNPIYDSNNPVVCAMKMPIRDLYAILKEEQFKIIVYCVLLGMQIVVRGEQSLVTSVLNVLKALLPRNWSRCQYSDDYLKPEVSNFLGLGLHVAVPQSSDLILRLDIVGSHYYLKWPGHMPEKLPTLLTKILKAVEDERLLEPVLETQLNVFVEEWSNIAQTLFWAQENNGIDKLGNLMKALGVQLYDLVLIKYWILQVALYSKSNCI